MTIDLVLEQARNRSQQGVRFIDDCANRSAALTQEDTKLNKSVRATNEGLSLTSKMVNQKVQGGPVEDTDDYLRAMECLRAAAAQMEKAAVALARISDRKAL